MITGGLVVPGDVHETPEFLEALEVLAQMQRARPGRVDAIGPAMERHPTKTVCTEGWSIRFRWPLRYRYASDGGWIRGHREIISDGWYWQWPVYVLEWFEMKDVLIDA